MSSLDDDGKANRLRVLQRFVGGAENPFGAWKNRNASGLHGGARFFLLTHQAHHVRRRADELDVAGFDHLGEVGVLAEEAVAGMDGVHVGDLGGLMTAGMLR